MPNLLIFALFALVVIINWSNYLESTNSEKPDQNQHSNLSANSTQPIQSDSNLPSTNSLDNVAKQTFDAQRNPQNTILETSGNIERVETVTYPGTAPQPYHPNETGPMTMSHVAPSTPEYSRLVSNNTASNLNPSLASDSLLDPMGSFDTGAPRLISSAQRQTQQQRNQERMALIAELREVEHLSPAQIVLLLKESIDLYENRRAISAKIRHRTDVLGYEMVGAGTYLEQRTIDKQWMRFELNLQIKDEVVSLIQACDGNFLWTYKSMPNSKELEKVDVAAVNAAWQSKSPDRFHPTSRFEMMPSLGGLAKFLRALSSNFIFNKAQRGRWGSDNVLIWKIEGSIRPDSLAELVPSLKEAIELNEEIDLDDIPPQIPNYACFYIGQDDLFPYRIEYHRVATPYSDESKTPADRKTEIVAMQFYDVVFDRPVELSRFEYQPPANVEPIDVTSTYINSLKR